jgi:hypothetical protein
METFKCNIRSFDHIIHKTSITQLVDGHMNSFIDQNKKSDKK